MSRSDAVELANEALSFWSKDMVAAGLPGLRRARESVVLVKHMHEAAEIIAAAGDRFKSMETFGKSGERTRVISEQGLIIVSFVSRFRRLGD